MRDSHSEVDRDRDMHKRTGPRTARGKVERDEGSTTGVLTGQKVRLLHLLRLLSL